MEFCAEQTERRDRGGAPVRSVRTASVLTAIVVLLAGCAADVAGDAAPAPPAPPASASRTASADPPAAAAPSSPESRPADVVGPECQEVPGATVEQLPDVAVPAVEIPALRDGPWRVAGQDVPAVVLPPATVPAQFVDGGCIIRYDAPADCLGAVEITGVSVPGARLPAVEVPAVELAAGEGVPGKQAAAEQLEAETAGAERAPEVCQREEAGLVRGVVRPGITRRGVVRRGAVRAGLVRAGFCVGSECVEPVAVSPVSLPPVAVSPATVAPEVLETRVVEGAPEVEALGEGAGTVFVAPADVLFDIDRDEVRPDADAALRTVASELAAQGSSSVRVEGHTDSEGEDAYNQDLSQRRARSVADWLVANAGVAPGAVSTAGLGETKPVADNAIPAGRQANRRVVLSAG